MERAPYRPSLIPTSPCLRGGPSICSSWPRPSHLATCEPFACSTTTQAGTLHGKKINKLETFEVKLYYFTNKLSLIKGTSAKLSCKTFRVETSGTSSVTAGWALTEETTWPRRPSTPQRPTRSPASGQISSLRLKKTPNVLAFLYSSVLNDHFSQEHFPKPNVDRFQGRTHLGVHRGPPLSEPLHTGSEGLLLHVPAPLHHGHQHRLLEHSCGCELTCDPLIRWLQGERLLTTCSCFALMTFLFPSRLDSDHLAGHDGGDSVWSPHVPNQHPHHHHLQKNPASSGFQIQKRRPGGNGQTGCSHHANGSEGGLLFVFTFHIS